MKKDLRFLLLIPFALSLGCVHGLIIRVPLVPPIVDCAHPSYQLNNSVRSLMSWSNYYHDQLEQGKNLPDACAKTLSYRGSANCIDPGDSYVRESLRHTLDICAEAGLVPNGADEIGGSADPGEEEVAPSRGGDEHHSTESPATSDPEVTDESATESTEPEPSSESDEIQSDPARGPGHAAPPKTSDADPGSDEASSVEDAQPDEEIEEEPASEQDEPGQTSPEPE